MKKVAQKPVVVPRINLMPRDPFYESLIGKIMVWSIKVGRYIIVFTEIIVIMSFASRFKLDRDNTDLTARITQKKAIIQSYGDIEPRTRLLQEKISATDKLLKSATAIPLFNLLASKIPPEVALTDLSYDSREIRISGRALTSHAFATTLTALQKEPRFISVSVDKITSGDQREPGIMFTIRLTVTTAAQTKSTAPTTKTEGDTGI